MMFLLQLLFTTAISYGVAQINSIPWWSFSICCFLVALLFSKKPWAAFLQGFIAISILWMGMATVIDVRTHSILSTKIAPIFKLPNVTSLVIVTGCIGGIVGGLAALAGNQLRALLTLRKNNSYKNY